MKRKYSRMKKSFLTPRKEQLPPVELMGEKTESYWKNEEEIIFKPASYSQLSKEEKIIYSEQLWK